MGWRSPDTYVEIVNILAEKGVLPQDFVGEAKNMARFRNILVHGYISIDIEKIHGYLKKIDKIKKFASYIVDFLVSRSK